MQEERQPESVTLPMETITEIVKLINTLPYGQVAPLAQQVGQCIQMARQEANNPPGKVDKPH